MTAKKDDRLNKLDDRFDADKNNRGGHGKNVLDLSDHEIEWFRPSSKDKKKGNTGRNLIAIIPYPISMINQKLHPKMEVGDYDYKLSLFTHKNVGENNDHVICPTSFGKPCPICEEQKQINFDDNKELWRSLKAVERPIYQVIDTDDEEKGVQIWQVAYNTLEKPIRERLDADEVRGKAKQNPFNPSSGLAVDFMSEDDPKWGYQLDSFEITEIDSNYQKMIDKTLPLDDMLNILTYDEIRNLHLEIDTADIETKDEENQDQETSEPEAQKVEEKEEETQQSSKRKRTRRPSKDANNRCPYADTGGIFGRTFQDDNLPDLETGDKPCDVCENTLFEECGDLFDKNKK